MLPRTLLPIVLTALLAACGEPPSAAGIGVSAPLPAGWHYATDTDVDSSGGTVAFSPAALDRALARGRNSPLFAMSSVGPGSRETGATVGISVQRKAHFADSSARQILAASIDGTAGSMTLARPVAAAPIGDRPGALVELTAAAGTSLRIGVVLIDTTAFTVAASWPTANAASLRPRVDAFFAELRFADGTP